MYYYKGDNMADFFSMIMPGAKTVLDSIFCPILAMDPNQVSPALTVLIIAFIVSLITTIANKYLVDQDAVNEHQAIIELKYSPSIHFYLLYHICYLHKLTY